jgi:histidine ammonia-lyase
MHAKKKIKLETIHHISPDHLSIDRLEEILANRTKIALSKESISRIKKCRDYLENRLNNTDELIYGINTGFGSLCDIKIAPDQLSQLQKNLVLSHACGLGDQVPDDIVRLMLILKVQSLSYGHSGVRIETVERLIQFYNNDWLPVVYQKGSLGASGDLAPLAHLCLPLIGEGEFVIKGKIYPASKILSENNLQPLELQAKEGLALLNGTQFMSAYGCWNLIQAKKCSRVADIAAALSLDGFHCKTDPFWPYIHNIRPHKGQKETAASILEILEGSEIVKQPKKQVQDPYAFRCIPQVHGASKDAIEHVAHVFETEINSVTDNPNIFPDEDLILSGGNFHGQPLAITMDYLAIALAELGNISERRTYQLLSGKRNLPEFLVANPGVNSGLMIPQYAAAALVSENKQLCTPASVDSITSSNGQEDHVSMGANAATKCYRVVQNLGNILAVEWLTASQAVHFRKSKTSDLLEKMLSDYRIIVPFIDHDRYLHDDIVKTAEFLQKI